MNKEFDFLVINVNAVIKDKTIWLTQKNNGMIVWCANTGYK